MALDPATALTLLQMAQGVKKGMSGEEGDSSTDILGMLKDVPHPLNMPRILKEKMGSIDLSKLGLPLNSVGNLLTTTAPTGDGDINLGQATLGSALSGAAGGASFGPLGLGIGALIGGLGGFTLSSNQKIDFAENERRIRRNEILNSTIEPFGGYFQDGGDVESILDLVAIQTEVGESMLLPDGSFSEVSADKKHSKMSPNQPTDFVPEGTIVFSEENKFNPKDLTRLQNFLGYSVQKFEEGKPVQKLEEQKLTDIIGDKKQSYSDAAKKVSKAYSVNTDLDDVIAQVTNAENVLHRSDILFKIADMQEGPESKQGIFQTGTSSTGVSELDDIFKTVFSDLDDLERLNFDELQESQDDYANLNRRLQGRNAAFLASQLLSSLGQSTVEQPILEEFSALPFQQIPQSLLDEKMTQIENSSDSFARQLLDSGVDPKVVPSLVARVQGQSSAAASDLAFKSILDTVQTDKEKYATLNAIRNKNTASITRAENLERSQENKRRAIMGRDIGSFIETGAELDSANVANRRAATGQFNKAQLQIDQARRESTAQRARLNMLEKYYESIIAGIAGGKPQPAVPPVPSVPGITPGIDIPEREIPPLPTAPAQFDIRMLQEMMKQYTNRIEQ